MKYSKPRIKIISIDYANVICASYNPTRRKSSFSSNTSIDVPQAVKDIYSGMTMRQKAAAMNLMMILGSSCPPTPACISEINKIMTYAGKSMGISGREYKSYTDSFGNVNGMIGELKGVKDKTVMDALFLAFFSVVSVGKSEQGLSALLNIYSEFGYTEEDCYAILQKTEAFSRHFS